jgi:type II secretory ATPase GspE/PulE/Tfp pilus assembly ATPase PilB-like protein
MDPNQIIQHLHELPDGAVISLKGKPLEVLESARNSVAVLQPTSGSEGCWILATAEAAKGTELLQIKKRAKDQNIEVKKIVRVVEGVLRALYEKAEKEESYLQATGSLQDSHVVRKFDDIMQKVIAQKASDIHIEKRADHATIKIRKNGELVPLKGYEAMSPTEATTLCGVIYTVLAEDDSKDITFNEKQIQQGAIKTSVTIDGEVHEVKLRFQSLQAYPEGFDVIMRVLPVGRNEPKTMLSLLGYEHSQEKMIEECIGKAVGAVIIAGVTGSGKSTTLKNMMMMENEASEYSEKFFTVEDPPEYIIPYTTQVPVARRRSDEEKGTSAFGETIRAVMRADPDVIMIGEIRDVITGDLLKKAVQSGHRVRTTVHASSPFGIIDRLTDFGITNSTMSSQDFISGLIYQRLLAKLCDKCSIPLSDAIASARTGKRLIDLNRRIEKALSDNKENVGVYMAKVRLRGEGCSNCQRGVTGRTVCAEVVRPDLKLLEFFKDGELISALKYLRNQISDQSITSRNMVGKSSMAHAFVKMINGEVDPMELERSFGIISIQEIRGLPEVHASDYKDDEQFKF